MKPVKIGFIGLGLIGGSIAKTIRRIHPDIILIAHDKDRASLSLALEEGILSAAYDALDEAFLGCQYIFLCAPVQKNEEYLAALASFAGEGCIITDVGSVKSEIHEAISNTPLAPFFIGGHPMAGSEKSGYLHSTPFLLENAYYILTPSPEMDQKAAHSFREFIATLGAIPLLLDYREHDYITASISHLPHILASLLVNLVNSQDNQDRTMKRVAAGGFKDITRIASSSPVMWKQICLANREQIVKVLELFSDSLDEAKERIAACDDRFLLEFFQSAKDYRDSLPLSNQGSLPKVYDLYCELADEAGGIATLATILADHQISIKNIGIIHNREFEDGVLHIEFYEERALKEALILLRKYHYTVYER